MTAWLCVTQLSCSWTQERIVIDLERDSAGAHGHMGQLASTQQDCHFWNATFTSDMPPVTIALDHPNFATLREKVQLVFCHPD